ncbi:uncharacterized mitochondrial protein AtMg00810-like [Solanum verrucosum]|uniref:uncharacterized mitochondrial protein AtMg00810-like n=1 Tax=Solanum verrucosum TaxID=315347 RepID=UPI0020D1C7C5|nr:uncharacterized mitochondrial protein AtMg00810-like [Solanum verrucosum]
MFAPVAKHDTIKMILGLASQNGWIGEEHKVYRLKKTLYGLKQASRACVAMFKQFKESMMKEFDMTDLGRIHYFLGSMVIQSSDGFFISQRKYVQDLLIKFQMEKCNPICTPIHPSLKLDKDPDGKVVDGTYYKKLVGSLMYLRTTRPDIMYAVSLISRYMDNPKQSHHRAANHILRYLQGTISHGLLIKGKEVH